MGRFLTAAGGDRARAKRMYRANMRLLQAFQGLLFSFEICLRNQLHQALTQHFHSANWIVQEKTGFMSDSLLGQKFFLRHEVEQAERKLRNLGKGISSDRLIAEQTLGFWTSFLEPRHFRLLRASPLNAFPHRPSSTSRAQVYKRLDDIRKFRNRISHHEPICFNGGNFDLSYAQSMHSCLIEVGKWIDPTFSTWLSQMAQVPKRLIALAKL